ncbi:MAG: hypothetical protein NT099_02170 [Candidatus Saganbacteria bacterium]|nr:hypothetical protein [Candidatus Saganbacteria bacterium]
MSIASSAMRALITEARFLFREPRAFLAEKILGVNKPKTAESQEGAQKRDKDVLRRRVQDLAFTPVTEDLGTNIRKIVNPKGENKVLFYPAMGTDVLRPFDYTDADVVVGVDLAERYWIPHLVGVSCFEELLWINLQEDSRVSSLRPWEKLAEGKSRICFDFLGKPRVLIVYKGDATQILPEEIEGGYNLLFSAGELSSFFEDKTTFERYVGRLKIGGFVVGPTYCARRDFAYGFWPVARTAVVKNDFGAVSRIQISRKRKNIEKPAEFFTEREIKSYVEFGEFGRHLRAAINRFTRVDPEEAKKLDPLSGIRNRVKDTVIMLGKVEKKKEKRYYARRALAQLKPLQLLMQGGEIRARALDLVRPIGKEDYILAEYGEIERMMQEIMDMAA